MWPVEKGDWAAVVMNADGSAGIRTATRVSLRTDLVIWLGIGALVAGIALAGTGTALLVGRRGGPPPPEPRLGPDAPPREPRAPRGSRTSGDGGGPRTAHQKPVPPVHRRTL